MRSSLNAAPPGEGGVSIAWFKVVRHSAFRKDVDLPED